MTRYVFNWKEEAQWALVTFLLAFGASFLLTETNPVTDWSAWLVSTGLAAARVAVAQIVTTLTRWLRSRPEIDAP